VITAVEMKVTWLCCGIYLFRNC